MPDDERTIREDTEAFDELFAIEPLHPDRVGAFVARGAVRKCDVLAHFIGRDEAEIVVLPDHVTNVKVQRIADRKR